MCPHCGDAMYPNGMAQIMSALDLWHCYNTAECNTTVIFKYRRTVFGLPKIESIYTHPPTCMLLDEELERMANQLV